MPAGRGIRLGPADVGQDAEALPELLLALSPELVVVVVLGVLSVLAAALLSPLPVDSDPPLPPALFAPPSVDLVSSFLVPGVARVCLPRLSVT